MGRALTEELSRHHLRSTVYTTLAVMGRRRSMKGLRGGELEGRQEEGGV